LSRVTNDSNQLPTDYESFPIGRAPGLLRQTGGPASGATPLCLSGTSSRVTA
jgi:hypothetical protein